MLPLQRTTFLSPNPNFSITSPALYLNLVHPQHPFSQSSCLGFRFPCGVCRPSVAVSGWELPPHCRVSLEGWRAELLFPVATRKLCPYTPIFWRSRAFFFFSEEQPLGDTAPYLFWPAAGLTSSSSVCGGKTWVLLHSKSEPLQETFCNPASSVIAWLKKSLSRKICAAGKLALLLRGDATAAL